MFDFIRDSVSVFKIRKLMGIKANWISEVEFPNVQVGSILPVIIATFPSGDVRTIHSYRNDRIDVMGRMANAGISVVAADLEVCSVSNGKIEGFKLIPDYNTRVTAGQSPTICEYLALKKLIAEYNSKGTSQILYVSRLKDLEEGQILPGIEYKHPSGATTVLAVKPFCDIATFQTLDVLTNLRKVEGFGDNSEMVKITIDETNKGRARAYTASSF